MAPAATVLSSAVPMEPPTCCAVLVIAEATPASRASTPWAPRLKAGMNAVPMPAPTTISASATEA